jgi:hypothetical protein
MKQKKKSGCANPNRKNHQAHTMSYNRPKLAIIQQEISMSPTSQQPLCVVHVAKPRVEGEKDTRALGPDPYWQGKENQQQMKQAAQGKQSKCNGNAKQRLPKTLTTIMKLKIPSPTTSQP